MHLEANARPVGFTDSFWQPHFSNGSVSVLYPVMDVAMAVDSPNATDSESEYKFRLVSDSLVQSVLYLVARFHSRNPSH